MLAVTPRMAIVAVARDSWPIFTTIAAWPRPLTQIPAATMIRRKACESSRLTLGGRSHLLFASFSPISRCLDRGETGAEASDSETDAPVVHGERKLPFEEPGFVTEATCTPSLRKVRGQTQSVFYRATVLTLD